MEYSPTKRGTLAEHIIQEASKGSEEEDNSSSSLSGRMDSKSVSKIIDNLNLNMVLSTNNRNQESNQPNKERDHGENRASRAKTQKIDFGLVGIPEQLLKSYFKEVNTPDASNSILPLDSNRSPSQVELDMIPKSSLPSKNSRAIGAKGKHREIQEPSDPENENTSKTEKTSKSGLNIVIPRQDKNANGIIELAGNESSPDKAPPLKSVRATNDNISVNSSVSEAKIQTYWQKIHHSINFSQHLKGLNNLAALKKLSKHQLELISDFSHAQLDHTKILEKSISLRRSNTPNPNKLTGPSKLKRLISKHAVEQKDMQEEFFAKIMKKIQKRRKSENVIKIAAKSCWNWTALRCSRMKRRAKVTIETPFNPDGLFRIFWDFLIIFFIIYDLIMVPFEISFAMDFTTVTNAIDDAVAACFILDMVLTFNTGYYSKGMVILDRKKIARNYIRGWFWLDLVASFPYEITGSGSDSTNVLNNRNQVVTGIRVLKFLRIIRVVRVLKLNIFMHKIEDYFQFEKTINGLISLTKLFFEILFIAHFVACLWHLIGSDPTAGQSWMIAIGIQDESLDERYVASFYWAITTMITVGYGDIIAITLNERIFNIAVMIIGCGVFAYTMNRVGTMLMELDGGLSQQKQEILSLTKYMSKKKVDKETQARVRKYLEYVMESQRLNKSQDESILSDLSDNLRSELLTQVNGKVLKEVSMFTMYYSTKFLIALSTCLKEKTYSPEEIIFNEGEFGSSMYFVMTGKIELFFARCRSVQLKTLERGGYFGEIAFFAEQERTASSKALTFSSLFILHKEDFVPIVHKFYSDKEFYCYVRDNIILYKHYRDLQLKCYSCENNNHIASECPSLHHFPDYDAIYRENTKNYTKFLKTYKRNNRKCFKLAYSTIAVQARQFVHKNYNLIHDFQQKSDSLGSNQDFNVLRSIRNSSEFREYESGDNLETHLRMLLEPRRATNRKQSKRIPTLLQTQMRRSDRKRGVFGVYSIKQPTLQSQASIEMNILNSPPSNSNLNARTLQLFKRSMELNLISEDAIERSPGRYNNKLMQSPATRKSVHSEEENKEKQGSIIWRGSEYVKKGTKEGEVIDYMEEDTVKNYEIYFPHNNITKIIDEIEKKQKRVNRLERLATGNVVLEMRADEIKENLGLNIGKFIRKQALRSSIGQPSTPRLSSSSISKTPTPERRSPFKSHLQKDPKGANTPTIGALVIRPINREDMANDLQISKKQESPIQKLSRFAISTVPKFANLTGGQASALSPDGKPENDNENASAQGNGEGNSLIPLAQSEVQGLPAHLETTPKNGGPRIDAAAVAKKLRKFEL